LRTAKLNKVTLRIKKIPQNRVVYSQKRDVIIFSMIGGRVYKPKNAMRLKKRWPVICICSES